MNTQYYSAASGSATLILLDGGYVTTFHLEGQTSWLIGRSDPGRSAQPDIKTDSTLVSREHGWIKKIEGQWFFVDNPKNMNGTFHNGQRIPRPVYGMKQPVPLEDGDVLRIDNESNTSSRSILMLFITTPVQGSWRVYPLTGCSTAFIGRSRSCQISEPIPYMSATHAKITPLNGDFYLSDCGSKAGTILNGRHITGPVRLREKDCICICDCRFFFLGNKLLYTSHLRNP